MEFPEPWVDAEEWPEPTSDIGRETMRSFLEWFEHERIIDPAIKWAMAELPAVVLEGYPNVAARMVHRCAFRRAITQNERN